MKTWLHILTLAACAFLLAGCGENQELTVFHDEMDDFYHSLSISVNSLENIDTASETAVDEMLAELDAMTELFDGLAAIEVPEFFENVEEPADEAAEYMAQAVSLYHEAYADGGYDDIIAQAAIENYTRAMRRVNYIAILLQRRYPDDENVTVVSEPDEPDWNGGEPQTAGTQSPDSE